MTLEVPKVPERSLTIRRDHVAFGTVAKRSRNMKNEITESYETIDFVRVYGRDFRRLQCMFPTIYFQIDCFSHRLRWFVALVVSHVFVTHVLASRMSFTGSKSPNSGMSEQRSPPPCKPQHIFPITSHLWFTTQQHIIPQKNMQSSFKYSTHSCFWLL